MQKIIKLSSHGTTNSGNDPVRVLKTLRELHDQMAKAVESCVMMAEEFLPELAEMIDMDASEFFMRAGAVSYTHLYCYANYDKGSVEKQTRYHDPLSPLLFGRVCEHDVIKEKKMKTLIRSQLSLFD